jgi:hypothetical protein
MTVDVDGVNERLNGLVNLLNVVGIDGVDPNALVEEQKRLTGQTKAEGGAPAAAALSSDQQILEIIKKLQQAQADSPEILAALKSPELRALASLAAQKQAPPPVKAPEPEKKAPPSLEDVMDDDDNYPKIGPGYSDDISVVSDLTTPTVMTKQHIQDEEYYKDVNEGSGSLPPMNIALGGGPAPPARPPMTIGGGHAAAMPAPKKRNLVSAVHPGASRHAISKTGGAAAQRRINYQQAMAKLQSTGDYPSDKLLSPKKAPKGRVPGVPAPTPESSEFFPSIAENKKSRPRRMAAAKGKSKRNVSLASQEVQDVEFGDSTPATTKKTAAKEDWGTGAAAGWPAFDGDSKKSKDAFGKDDAFFGTPSFGAGGRDLKSPKSPKKKGKEEKRFAEIKITRDDGQGTKKTKEKKEKEKIRPKKTNRRASLSM